MILSDVFKRWHAIDGKKAYLCTGTDEHGMKIQRAAAKEGVPPKEFCDINSKKFQVLAEAANISNDFFIRTTDAEHKRSVEEFWSQLKYGAAEELGLYKGTHEGWYCVSDECFYPEDMVQPSIVPQTGRKMMASIETGSEVEWVKEETWFFPLSKYKDQLLKFYDENPDWIKPQHRMNEVRHWVENHLEDLSITRPASRLTWGIPDPEDGSNTIYVWVDALVNYLTKAGYGSKWHRDSSDKGIWPADVHVVGKDIIRFHAVYWPALLMAAGLPLPKKILCHNHWTMSNRKMSKSLGNVVNPFFAIQRWDVDPLRYFLMRNGSFTKDMGYSNASILAVYEKELQANIGNLFNRIARVRGNKWSIVDAVTLAREGAFAHIDNSYQQGPEKIDYMSLEPHLDSVLGAVRQEMEDYQPGAALRAIFEFLRETNRFLSDTAPWNLYKDKSEGARLLLNWVVYSTAEAVRIAAILLQPVMPAKAAELLDGLDVKPERRTLEYAQKGKDLEYGRTSEALQIKDRSASKWQSVFPPAPGIELLDEEAMIAVEAMRPPSTNNRMNRLSHYLAEEARAASKTKKEE